MTKIGKHKIKNRDMALVLYIKKLNFYSQKEKK